MHAFHISSKFVLTSLLSMAILSGFWPQTTGFEVNASAPAAADQNNNDHSHWSAFDDTNDFILEAGEEGSVCRDATGAESRYFAERSPEMLLRPINDIAANADGGLNLILRSTSQLEGFPQAKAAFLRAAALWQSLIQTSITIIIDVDFGTKRFGQDYPANVLGATTTQTLANSIGYLSFRLRMVGLVTDPAKMAFYNSLPNGSLPTDMGSTRAIATPSATLRVVGEINPVANPMVETNFGNPPSVGFNSAFEFDFDPSDGIDADKLDFEAVAVHEIGHALGFSSQAGTREVTPSAPIAASAWDLFRFRPDITLGGVGTAPRVLSSGGEQVFFAGDDLTQLSTGRPDGTGGDQRQSSHWKDDALTGSYIGIMDPTLPRGKHETVTAKDLAVLDALCYKVDPSALPPPPPPSADASPVIDFVRGSLDGNTLAITVNAADGDGDIVQVQSALLDESNRVVAENTPIDVGGDTTPSRTLVLNVGGMERFPTALKLSVTVVDSRSHRSNTAVLDFGVADSGGPSLRSGSFDPSGLLSLKGGPFTGELKLEVNGEIVAPPLRIKKKGGGGKLKISGGSSDLNLRSGTNRVRMINDGLRSNILVITI